MKNIKSLINSLQAKNKKIKSELDHNPKLIYKSLQDPNQLNTAWFGINPRK